jgi:endonuclease-8
VPEGDTIFRTAETLRRVLAGQPIVTCDSALPAVTQAAFAGHVVVGVEARGKNLLICFDDGRALHTHMRMNGSWHIYRVGERWLKRAEAARVVLTTATMVAVCFAAPVVRVIASGAIDRDPHIEGLGPDLLDPSCDLVVARANLRGSSRTEIGDALMMQRLVAGIGNVYKSETLFTCRVDPFVRVEALDDATLDRLLLEARTSLSRNVARGGPRGTRNALGGSRHWVYMRAREPCFGCRTQVAMRKQGAIPRSTYYCPRCQGVGAS